MTLRELLRRTSPVTFGLLLVHLLLLGGRLASARPTTPPLAPGEERPLAVEEGQKLRALEVLSPRYALAVYHGGRSSGGALLDWSRSDLLEGGGALAELELASDRTARRADQLVFLDDRPVTVSGQRAYAWRYDWDLAARRAKRERLPPSFLWLTDEGRAVTEEQLERPDGWPEVFAPSILVSGDLVLARPMAAFAGRSSRAGAAAATKAADDAVMIFDRHSGRALAKLDTERIRQIWGVVGGSGFAWTDDSSCWLKYATCDEQGRCRTGTSKLRALGPVFSASLREDRQRIAICTTRHASLYEGFIDGEIRFLGRAPISKACRSVVLTSDHGAAVMLEDRSWVTVSMEPRP